MALTILRDEGIHEDKRPKFVNDLLGDTRYDHATIGMAAEHDVRKFFPTDETQHVINVSIERDGRVHEMGPLAKTGERRSVDFVAGPSK